MHPTMITTTAELKSDYFRIEMAVFTQIIKDVGLLKSDYFRIEMLILFFLFFYFPFVKIRLF